MGKGIAITERLRSFNDWRDDFLIEASTLLLMIGFVMGTVDLLTRGGEATTNWFSLSWAIVQAIAIDGLFFAVWGKIARAKWEPGKRQQFVAMALVGLVLAVVAALVNGILSYQQITGIADSLTAMHSLGIDSITFVDVRSVLVVAVAILVSLFCRGRPSTETETETERQPRVSVETVSVSLDETAMSLIEAPLETPETERYETVSTETKQLSLEELLETQPDASVRDLAKVLKQPASTVGKRVKKIKEQAS